MGFDEVPFLSEPAYVLPTLAAIGIWQLVGFNMVLFLAGLSAIPRDLYEAAEIDGCRSGIDRFLTITWPLLGPTTMFVIVTTSITAFKVFDTVAVMTRGGPMGSSEVLLYAIYLEGFQYFHTGLRGGADADLPRVRAAVLDPADVRARAAGALLMATPPHPRMPPAGAGPRRRARSRRARCRSSSCTAILIAGAVFILLPFVWMLITSIKSPSRDLQPSTSACGRSSSAASKTMAARSRRVPLLRFALNGVIVCAGILVVQVLVAVPCAYALAKLRFPGRAALFALVLLGLCIPIQVPALPLYIALAELGLLNTYFAIMMPFFLSVFAIFLFRQFFKSYPDEIIHAARLDGMSEFEIVWLIVVPSAWPAIAAFSVFSIVAHWNDLYWPLIVISDTISRRRRSA